MPIHTLSPAILTRRTLLAVSGAAFFSIVLGASDAGAQSSVGTMTPDRAYAAAKAGDILLIDIRRPEEWLETGVAEGAIGLDMTAENFVPTLVALRKANPDLPLAMICRTGNRTGYATGALAAQGFPGLVDVNEGMVGGRNGPGWLARGLPTYAGTLENVTARTQSALP